jgi:hypothetical protein
MYRRTYSDGQGDRSVATVEVAGIGPLYRQGDSKRAAVVLTVDDVFPGTSRSAYEAGGDLERGALRHLLWLLERHPQLQVTLFVTPDWRQVSPMARSPWAHVPWMRDRMWLGGILPKGTMDIRRHPDFVAFLNAMPRTEIALHGLHHIHPGRQISVEFQSQGRAECAEMLREAMRIFDEAGLRWVPGLQPPGWNCPVALQHACHDAGIKWIMSARDIWSPVHKHAKAAMSGLTGVSIMFPEQLASDLLHLSTNFQATSPAERAFAILDCGGVLSIKVHVTKNVLGHTHLDGLDRVYMNYLDRLLDEIEDAYADDIDWTTVGRLAGAVPSLRPRRQLKTTMAATPADTFA